LRPSHVCARMGAVVHGAGRAGSELRISASESADTRYDHASTRIANGALNNWTSAPAVLGPPTSAIEELIASLLFPSTTRSRPMSDGTYAGYAAENNESRELSRNATM